MVREVAVTALRENPVNSKIYFTNQQDDDELVKLIEEYGIQRPILVAEDTVGKGFIIVSGHRRWRAACKLGMHTVPIEIERFNNQDEITQRLIIENAYREKTMEEKIREAQALKDILAKKGEKSRDAAGKAVGISGRSFDKGERVVEAIDAIRETDPERADELREKLNKSIDGAYREVRDTTEVVDGIEASVEEEQSEIERRRLYFWQDELAKLTSYMDVIYSKLAKQRNGTTPQSVGHMIGNIYEMRERLLSWTPKRMTDCPVCGGTGQERIPDANGGTTVVECTNCVEGKIGLYKESKH